ncbi:hypothetical protein HOE67_02130 [Candidatus Peregrinibacteria bacterium]|nr:hypothetical protein [Candidatus Peregrinibacteria bacterium]MBT4055887.1 hypothetical protein [Candidatus Peregrinibacteria bacterium]
MGFLEDYKALQLKTPRIGAIQLKHTNSDFCYNIDECKNCYLLANAVVNEDCMYGRDFYSNQDCVDCDHILKCTLCYECINCKHCYNCTHMQDSENCHDCEYGYDLRQCKNCFGCATLRNKEYYIFNKPHSKEEYETQITELRRLPHHEITKKFEETQLETPRVYCVQTKSENFVGNYLSHCQNTIDCFDIVECQDCAYTTESKKCKDSYDNFVNEHGELCYNLSSCHIMHNCDCCFFSTSCSDCAYSELLINCDHCFGCVSLHYKKYHILNEPYSKEDYEKRITEIKQELRDQNLYGVLTLPPTYPLEDTVGSWKYL